MDELKSQQKKFSLLCKSAEADRLQWLTRLADQYQNHGLMTKHKAIIALQKREEARTTARRIKAVQHKLQSTGISFVSAPSSDGQSWQEISAKHLVEKTIMEVNMAKYSQARSTPFLTEPLASMVGPLGLSQGADEILQGSFQTPAEVPTPTRRVIQQLQRPTQVKDFPNYIPTDTYQSYWTKAREFTAAGPSGLHFGHLRAGATDDEVAAFEASMNSIPMMTGYSPTRWKKGIDAMLLKKQGVFQVDKLRTILLYEADFNYMNKFLGRHMLAQAEQYNLMAPEQYGSRKQHRAIDQALNKRISFDILRQQRQPGALCSNDAKSCYDRIVHSVASISLQRVGVPKLAVQTMFNTIQGLHHVIRTAHGDSLLSYSGESWDHPLHGVGQGNGAGPSIWALVSSPILNSLRSQGYGTNFQGPISRNHIQFVGYAFVDDTDIVQTASNATEPAALVAAKIQASMDEWEGGLWATGGALAPAKSHWYLIDFQWHKGQWRYRSNQECPAQLSIRNHHGQRITLPRLEPHEARTTLGVNLAPDGNHDSQAHRMRRQAEEWADHVRTGYLQRHEVWVALHSTILRSLDYPLPATSLTFQQCSWIMAPVLQAALPAMGVSRSFPRAMVHAPLSLSGLGIPHLFHSQGINHLQSVLDHTTRQTITGQLLQASLEALIIEGGIGPSILHQPYSTFSHWVTPSWWKQLWYFMDLYDITLHHNIDTPLQSVGDCYLMERLSQQNIPPHILQILN